MVSKEQRDYLTLYKSIMDTGAEVVRMYTESKCKSKYGIDFATYLESEKHYFYHQWEVKRKKPFCCDCPPTGCNIPKTGNMNNKMFTKWYKFYSNIPVPRGHMDAQHFCICQYTAQNLSIEGLDLSDLKFLLKNTKLLSQADACQLEIISTVRNSVCHAVSTNMFTENDLKDLRLKFETSTLQLTEELNKRMVKMLFKIQPFISSEEVEKLMKEISDFHVENNHNTDTVISKVDHCIGKSENNIKHHVTEVFKKTENNIKHHVTEELSYKIQQVKNEVMERSSVLREDIMQSTATIGDRIQLAEERIQTTTTTLVKQGQNELAGEISESISDAQQQIRSDINANTKELHDCFNKNMEDLKDNIEDIVKRVIEEKFSELTAKIEINSLGQAGTNTNEEHRQVKFEIKFESDVLNEDKAQTNLTSQTVPYTEECNNDENKIKVHSVTKNCILLEASASFNIFRSKETLRSAIRALIQKVLDAGEVDTSKEATVKVNFRIITPLNDDETKTVLEMVCREKFANGNQTDKCQEKQPETVDVECVQDTPGDICSGSQTLNVCARCDELQKLLEETNDIIRKKETNLALCARCEFQKLVKKIKTVQILKKANTESKHKLNDTTADICIVSQTSNMCAQCNTLLRLHEEKNDIIRKQETHLTAKDKQIETLRTENEDLKKRLRDKDYISVDSDITTDSDDKVKASAKKRIKRDKDNDVDIFGKTYLSLQSTYMYESVRLKGEPYLINAGAVFVFQKTRFSSQFSAKTNPDSTFLSLAELSRHVIEAAKSVTETHWVFSERFSFDDPDEKTADFARIAERFSEFQGFKFHEQISYNDVFDIVKETNKRIKTEMDCLVVLIPQIGRTSDLKDLLEISLSMSGGKPTVIIMQAETNVLTSSFLTKVLTTKDCIVAIFTAKTEVVAKLLGAATEEMKSGDNFANVLRAVSKQVESANMSQSIVFSTLTKELCFQKRKF